MNLSKFSFDGFGEYFFQNMNGAKTRYKEQHEKFRLIFDEIIKIGCSTNFKSSQTGTSIIIFLRATKYLFVAHNLVIQGHTEEARILLRNIIELIILAHLISKSDDVYSLWKECSKLRIKHTNEEGVVNMQAFKEQKYKIKEIIKKHRVLLKDNFETQYLERRRGQFSEYFSHENLFNIVPRVESGKEKSEVYIGNSFESNDRRMLRVIEMTIDIEEEILKLMRKLVPINKD